MLRLFGEMMVSDTQTPGHGTLHPTLSIYVKDFILSEDRREALPPPHPNKRDRIPLSHSEKLRPTPPQYS